MANKVLDLITALAGNRATGASTATTTPPANDNSKRTATTDWLYSGALGFIAAAAGFAFQKQVDAGYIKLPSWLGGLILQWGVVLAVPPGSSVNVNFPLVFPNAVLNTQATVQNTGGQPAAMAAGTGTGAQHYMPVFHNGNTTATAINWLAIGW